jgi:hypothetical protein
LLVNSLALMQGDCHDSCSLVAGLKERRRRDGLFVACSRWFSCSSFRFCSSEEAGGASAGAAASCILATVCCSPSKSLGSDMSLDDGTAKEPLLSSNLRNRAAFSCLEDSGMLVLSKVTELFEDSSCAFSIIMVMPAFFRTTQKHHCTRSTSEDQIDRCVVFGMEEVLGVVGVGDL